MRSSSVVTVCATAPSSLMEKPPPQVHLIPSVRYTGDRSKRVELSRYFLPVKNSLMFSPLNLAPSTMV